jgi:hypothetical protein
MNDMSSPGQAVGPLWNICPWTQNVSEYDRYHLTLFAILLDAEAEGVCPQDMARYIFRIDPAKEPRRAARVVQSHLARAHWLRQNGFPYLAW